MLGHADYVIAYVTHPWGGAANCTEYERVKNVYILKRDMLCKAKENMKIMHPLPRVNEIAYDVDDDPHAYYIQQAQNGLYAREAIFCHLPWLTSKVTHAPFMRFFSSTALMAVARV